MTVQLLDILTEEEAIPAKDLERVLEQQRQLGGCLADYLLQAQLISEDDLFYLMSQRMGVPPLAEERLLHHNLAPEVRRRVPMPLAEQCVLLPLDFNADKSTLSVVMLDPTDEWVSERLCGAARVTTLRPYIARRSSILEAIRAVYGRQHRYVLPGAEVRVEERPPVEAIRGKVEIDASLAEEIASIEEDDYAGEMLATSVKQVIRGEDVDDEAPTPPPQWVPHRSQATKAKSPSRPGEDTDETLAPAEEAKPQWLRPPDEKTNEVPLVPTTRNEIAAEHLAEDFDKEPDVLEVLSVLGPSNDDSDEGINLGTGRWRPESGDYDETSTGEPDVVLTPEPPEDVATVLLGELSGSVGVLVSMLEERIDPGGAVAREHAKLSRLVAREIGLDSLTIDRVTVAAHLYGLDIALRRELEGERLHNVAETFSSKPTRPGGLNPTLRSLGARSLGLSDEAQRPLGAALISLVSDYLDLRLESCDESSETVVQLLRAGDADGQLVDALLRVIEDEETLVETRRSQVERR